MVLVRASGVDQEVKNRGDFTYAGMCVPLDCVFHWAQGEDFGNMEGFEIETE